jgi:hypothetical protein
MDFIINQNKNKKPKKKYFTQQAENAIIQYNLSDDPIEKSNIYERYIHWPFYKLTENIIHTFKFRYTEVENLEDLQHEIIVFLLDKIHLYHHSRSVQDRLCKIIKKEFKEEQEIDFISFTNNSPKVTQDDINDYIELLGVSDECKEALYKITPPKAYSYFGTIVKRWLINYNNKNYKNKISNIPIITTSSNMESDNDGKKDNNIYLEDDKDYSDLNEMSDNDKLSLFIDNFVEYCNNHIYELFPKDQDAKIADAVLELFRKRQNIDLSNKKAVYIYLREIIDVKTPRITKVANKLNSLFKNQYLYYLEHNSYPAS